MYPDDTSLTIPIKGLSMATADNVIVADFI